VSSRRRRACRNRRGHRADVGAGRPKHRSRRRRPQVRVRSAHVDGRAGRLPAGHRRWRAPAPVELVGCDRRDRVEVGARRGREHAWGRPEGCARSGGIGPGRLGHRCGLRDLDPARRLTCGRRRRLLGADGRGCSGGRNSRRLTNLRGRRFGGRRDGLGARRRVGSGRRHRGRGGLCRRGRHRHGRRRSRALRQERQRVAISLRVRGDAHAEVHVRLCEVGVARGERAADDVSFRDLRVPRDGERGQMRERDRQALGGRDRDARAGGRDGAGERHQTCGRGEHGRAGVGADHDAAMLPRRIRVRRVEQERLEDCPVRGPGPGLRCGHDDERGEDRDEHETTHV
jgi:hypothetical protein